jgi:hypothetical protein
MIWFRLGVRLVRKSGVVVVQAGEQNAVAGIILFFLMEVSRAKVASMGAGSLVFCQTLIWKSLGV